MAREAVSAPHLRARLLALQAAGRVRLDREEIEALAYALDGTAAGSIALFGSRVEPLRRGGDVDLLLRTDAPAYETSKHVATRFFSRCEEKIDVVVMPECNLLPEQEAFLRTIRSVELI